MFNKKNVKNAIFGFLIVFFIEMLIVYGFFGYSVKGVSIVMSAFLPSVLIFIASMTVYCWLRDWFMGKVFLRVFFVILGMMLIPFLIKGVIYYSLRAAGLEKYFDSMVDVMLVASSGSMSGIHVACFCWLDYFFVLVEYLFFSGVPFLFGIMICWIAKNFKSEKNDIFSWAFVFVVSGLFFVQLIFYGRATNCEVDDKYSRGSCIMHKASFIRDQNICDSMPTYEPDANFDSPSQQERGDCYFIIAQERNDNELCNIIYDEDIKARCKLEIKKRDRR